MMQCLPRMYKDLRFTLHTTPSPAVPKATEARMSVLLATFLTCILSRRASAIHSPCQSQIL